MVKRFIVPALVSLLIICGSISAQEPVSFRISPEFGISFGETAYEIRLAGLDTVTASVITLRSRLGFPVDTKLAGGRIGLYKGLEAMPRWSLDLRVLSNLGDPGGVVTDQDWIGQLNQFEIEFSNTESDAEGSVLQIDFEGSLLLLETNRFGLSAVGGLWYEKIDQTVVGVTGWQLEPGQDLFDFGNQVFFDLDGPVGEYRVTYKVPHIGVAGRLLLSARSTIEMKASGCLAFFDDFDDHLLRGKTAEADGDGYGVRTAVSYHQNLGRGDGPTPFVAIEGQLTYLDASGKQKQTWYADDPATPNFDDTGTAVGSIPYYVELTQYAIMVRFGLSM